MNDENKQRILVVDDERDLCEILKYNLELEGYEVVVAHSADEALAAVESSLLLSNSMFRLLLLDVMMPEKSGFTLARELKDDMRTRDIPIIFLTARDAEGDVITGLNLGADDYIAKPFRLRELIARVNAVLRRTMPPVKTSAMPLDGIIIDHARKQVIVDGSDALLTRTEYDLLAMLVSESGRVFSRQELIQHVWPRDVVVTERSVDVCVTRLRKKIGRFAAHLNSKSGFGYYFK